MNILTKSILILTIASTLICNSEMLVQLDTNSFLETILFTLISSFFAFISWLPVQMLDERWSKH